MSGSKMNYHEIYPLKNYHIKQCPHPLAACFPLPDPGAKALQSHGAAHAAGIVFEPRNSMAKTMNLLTTKGE